MTTNLTATNTTVQTASIMPLTLKSIGLALNSKQLLHDVSIHFNKLESTLILGPNGAGKTMLLRICHGLIKPGNGKIEWSNPQRASQPDAQAMVFQHPVMLRRSVRKNIEYAMAVCNVGPIFREERMQQALELSGLSALADRPATRLSGGEKQRLALARCNAIQPEVLFLDEPTAHLDPAATRQIEHMIDEIKKNGCTVIMVTHDLGQAKRLADRILFMHHGRILEDARTTEFFATPKTSEGRAFVSGQLLW